MKNNANTESSNCQEKNKTILEQYLPYFIELLTNRLVMFALVITVILGYGFKITSVAISADDSAHLRYFHRPTLELVAQHRALFILYDRIVGLEYMPFWLDCLSVLLFLFGAVCWAVLFRRVSNNKIGIIPLTVFMAALLSFPLINTIFIYTGCNFAVCLGYLLTAAAMIFATTEVLFHGGKKYNLCAVIVLAIAISPYESIASVFLCGIFAVLFLHYWFNNQADTLVVYIKLTFKFLSILLLAIIVKYVVSEGIRLLVGQTSGLIRVGASNEIEWFAQGTIISKVYHFIFTTLGGLYFDSFLRPQFWAKELLVVVFVLFVCSVITAIRKKCIIPFVLLTLLIISTFSMSILQGTGAPARICQSYAFVVSVTLLLLLVMAQKYRMGYVVLVVISSILILAQTHNLSYWFYNNYQRYQYDLRTIEQLGWELQRYYGEKPVSFVGVLENPSSNRSGKIFSKTYHLGSRLAPNVEWCGTNGLSAVSWAVNSPGFRNNKAFMNLLEMHGYDFKQANDAQMAIARKAAKHMPSWPKVGSIKEFPEVIVVHFNDIPPRKEKVDW